jgi:preprotein translocase subunit SecD
MATHSFGPGSSAPSNSNSVSPAWSHSYSIAALRAGLIALALLAVLIVIVLS